ncbi:MAG: hypothetical protein R2850_05655 [Bacteroidia bacterium]
MPSGINKLILLSFFTVLISSLKAQPEIVLSGPDQIKIGTSTVIKISLTGTKLINGPARLELNIPEGWQIENYPGEVASFTQDGNIARVVWLEFPSRDSLNISAMIRLPSKEDTGSFSITGSFDYLDKGKPKTISTLPKTIRISRYFSRF